MTAIKGSENRVILPRWRAWRDSQSNGELDALQSLRPTPVTDDSRKVELSRRLDDFKDWSGVYEAADVVNAAMVLGLEDFPGVRDAARVLSESSLSAGSELARRLLLRSPEQTPEPLGELESRARLNANQARGEDSVRVAWLRSIVRREPRNSLRWADLALAHAILGNKRAAARAMHAAVSLSKGNRFILRSAARFHVHEGDLDAAHSLLIADIDRLLSDPWLMAAEIAIADMSDKPMRYAARGHQLLSSDFAPRHLSELASALATLEIKAGKVKRSRNLFKQSLEDPTENSLAQAEWSVERGIGSLPVTHALPPQNFEAETRHALRLGDFRSAAIKSRLWQEDQPFSIDPAIHASYIASTLAENYKLAITSCEKGLISNPGNPVLLNNLAFSQASAGLLPTASETSSELAASSDAKTLLTWTATRGLIAFRQGDLNEGRRLYRESIIGWRKQRDGDIGAAIAAVFLAREEIRAKTQYARQALELADTLCAKLPDGSDARILRRRLPEKLDPET